MYFLTFLTIAIDVREPSSCDYSTKPTSQVSTPPYRDHQHNNNQTIPTITTKDQNIDIPAGFSPSDQDDFHKMTLEELMHDEKCSIGVFASHSDVNKMTLEEQMEQYDEKCYNYFDNLDDDDEVIEIPHDMFDFDPTIETTTTTIPKNNKVTDITTTTGDEATNKKHTQPKDRQVSVISTNNKKRKKTKTKTKKN